MFFSSCILLGGLLVVLFLLCTLNEGVGLETWAFVWRCASADRKAIVVASKPDSITRVTVRSNDESRIKAIQSRSIPIERYVTILRVFLFDELLLAPGEQWFA